MASSSSSSSSSSAEAVEVVSVKIQRQVIDAAEELRELTGLAAMPFISVAVAVEISGVPTAMANALRRVLCDEMRGRCLIVGKPPSTTGTDDPHIIDEFVMNRVAMIALRARIPEDVARTVRFAVDVRNATASVMTVWSGDLKVTAGSLSEPIFDPTYEVITLQPGRVFRAEDIRVEEGYGRDFAGFQVCVRTAARPLDLAEAARKDTHEAGGAAVDKSGFAESSLVANPRRHLVTATLPVVPMAAVVDDVKTVLGDACRNLKERLRLAQSALEGESAAGGSAASGGSTFTLIELEADLAEGILRIKGETHTIGNLLARMILETTPDVSNVSYRCAAHESDMKLTVRHTDDVAGVVLRGIRAAHAMVDAIQRGIAASAPAVETARM